MNVEHLIRKLSKRNWLNVLVQFVKFGLVGISNTALNMAVYYIGLYWLRLHYQISNLLGFIISVTNSYYWNSKYVFPSDEKKNIATHLKAYFRTVVSYGIVFFITTILLWLWVEKMSISEQVAPILNLFITVPLNYLLNKFWTFRKCEEKTNENQQQN